MVNAPALLYILLVVDPSQFSRSKLTYDELPHFSRSIATVAVLYGAALRDRDDVWSQDYNNGFLCCSNNILMIRTEQATSETTLKKVSSSLAGVSGLKVGHMGNLTLEHLGKKKQHRARMEGAMGWTFLFVSV